MTATESMSTVLRPLCHLYYVPVSANLSSISSGNVLIIPDCTLIATGALSLSMVTPLHYRLDIHLYVYIIKLTAMRQPKANSPKRTIDAKVGVLAQHGALHPHPEQVKDEVFQRNEFFDSHDLVQVRYEMLRRRQVDGQPVTDVAAAFGVSRQAFYVTEATFAKNGIVGLLPRPRGPRRAHKCTDEILDFVEQCKADSSTGRDISEVVRKRFGVTVHPRSLARALARRKENQA